MVYTPFDFNEAIGHRKDYVEDRLQEGSPVVGLSFAGGVLLLTVRGSQRKVFEIYERLMYAGVGNQSDVEAIRVAAIDVAHREGYERSPDDVTAQRLVGFALSPPLKRLFGDQFNAPAVIRALFAELGRSPSDDAFFTLNYDGDFTQEQRAASIGPSADAEQRMTELLTAGEPPATVEGAVERALRAWAAGARMRGATRRVVSGDGAVERGEDDPAEDEDAVLRRELSTGTIEAGVLDRDSTRETKFRLLTATETDRVRDAVT